VRRQRAAAIRLEVLEDRLPPGDILFGLALGSVWLRPDNVSGDQEAAVKGELAVTDPGDVSVLPALDATLPPQKRHVSRLADNGSSHLSYGESPLIIPWLDQAFEAHARQVSAMAEGQGLISWQAAGAGVPWAKSSVASSGWLVVDLPAAQTRAAFARNEVNDQLPVAFDRLAGVLHIRADAPDQTISETVTPAGFVEITVDSAACRQRWR
jgi:hypothetical protein